MNSLKLMFLGVAAASVFALGAPLTHAEDPANLPNAPPAVAHDSLPSAVGHDFTAAYAGACTCSSALGFGCELQNDRCSPGFHAECHCSFFGGNACACKPN